MISQSAIPSTFDDCIKLQVNANIYVHLVNFGNMYVFYRFKLHTSKKENVQHKLGQTRDYMLSGKKNPNTK